MMPSSQRLASVKVRFATPFPFFLSTTHPSLLGHAEQWGAVSHKKDKKAVQAPAPSTRSGSFSADSDRGGFRGARGGRGGPRGARGGARGLGRGGHRESTSRPPVSQTPSAWDTGAASTEPAADPWGVVNGDSGHAAAADGQVDGDASNADASPTTGAQDAAAKPYTNGLQADKPVEARASAPSPASFAAKAGSKVPAAPVKSWAQIAKCVVGCISSFILQTDCSLFPGPKRNPRSRLLLPRLHRSLLLRLCLPRSLLLPCPSRSKSRNRNLKDGKNQQQHKRRRGMTSLSTLSRRQFLIAGMCPRPKLRRPKLRRPKKNRSRRSRLLLLYSKYWRSRKPHRCPHRRPSLRV